MDAKPWLTHYDQGVPHSLQPYPDKTLVDIVTETAHQRPDHPALLFKGARLSYRELDRETDAFAAALATLGVQKGDRVALVMPNSAQVIIAQLCAHDVDDGSEVVVSGGSELGIDQGGSDDLRARPTSEGAGPDSSIPHACPDVPPLM